MAAYGLYTHIASNKIRSMFLLAGLFVLIYVMVFAGALIAEVVRHGTNRTAAFYISYAWHDLIVALSYATALRCYGSSSPISSINRSSTRSRAAMM